MAQRAALWTLAVLMLCWPAIVNGQLFFFPDSTNYIRAGGAAVAKVVGTGFGSGWSQPAHRESSSPDEHGSLVKAEAVSSEKTPAEAVKINDPERGVVMAGRSPYVGALMFFSQVLGNFWPYAIGLAAIQFYLIDVTLRVIGVQTIGSRLNSAAILGFLTPSAFYNGYLLADAFCAHAFLGLGIWIVAANRLRTLDKTILAVLMVLSAIAHLTHIVVLVGVVLVVATSRLVSRQPWAPVRAALAVGIGSALIGLLSIRVTDMLIQKSFGSPPMQLPMLTARFIEDGPGTRFVKEKCKGDQFAVCQYRERLPVNSQAFLWDRNPKTAVFIAADLPTRRQMCAEDKRFAAAVFASYPMAQGFAVIRNTLEQLIEFRMHVFNYGSYNEHFAQKLPQDDYERMTHTRSFRNGWPTGLLDLVNYLVVALSCVVLSTLWWRRLPMVNADAQTSRRLVAICGLGLLINAAVCGAASEPQARYAARVIWVVPFLAFVWSLQIWKSSRRASR